MSTSSFSSSCVSTLYKECPSCTVMIEHTGGCDLISCPCGIFFSFTFPDINGKDKDQVQIAIQKKKKSEWMKQDRKNNPEKYRQKDKAKYEKIMNCPTKREKENERCKAKNKKYRQENDMSEYDRQRREIKKQRLTDGYKKCPICSDIHTCATDLCHEHDLQQKGILRQEMEIKQILVDMGFYPSLHDRKGPCGDSNNLRRADFVFASNDINYNIILEVDEDAHSSYTPECEIGRLADLRDQYPGKPIFFVRYGVERLKGANKYRRAVSSKSKKKLKNCLETVFSLPPPGDNELPLGYSIVYIGYTQVQIDLLTRTHDKMQHEKMIELQNLNIQKNKRAAELAKYKKYNGKR